MKSLKNLAIHLILSVGLLIIFVMSQLIGTLIFAPVFLQNGENLPVNELIAQGSQHGTIIGLTAILSFFVVLFFSYLFVKLQKQSFVKLMAIVRFDFKDLLKFGVALLLLNYAFYEISIWLNLDSMRFMADLSDTSKPLWLLVLAVVLVIPIYEELIFRGFMWGGLAKTVLGGWGASLMTGVVFALIHLQYGKIEWLMIFALALLFGYTRQKSGSLWLPVCLHILNNALAMWLFLGQN